MRRSLTALLVIAFPLAACSKQQKVDPGPDCPRVVDNMLVVMKQGLAGHDTVSLGNRNQMIAQCEQRKMTAKERKCLAEAKDLAGLASCRSAKPGAPASPPTPTRPLPIGGAEQRPTPAGSAVPATPAGSAQ